jgi:mono/diheme cytochrome c family protein
LAACGGSRVVPRFDSQEALVMRTVVLGVLTLPLLWPAAQAVSPAGAKAGRVERGRYIVERVSMCFECHTPRGEGGELNRARWLLGAPIPVSPPAFEEANWAIRAPRIAGMPGYTEDSGVRLLTRGIDRNGGHLKSPMPPFRFSEEDARAVVAYLKALEAPSEP